MRYVFEVRWRTDNNPYEGAGQDRFVVEAANYEVIRGQAGDMDSIVFRDEWANPIQELFSRPASIERLHPVEQREQNEAS